MSDTPRTDAASFWGRDMGEDSASPHEQCVPAELARDLERELAAKQWKLSQVYKWIERNHPDGFIDGMTHTEQLDRIRDGQYEKQEELEAEIRQLKKEAQR